MSGYCASCTAKPLYQTVDSQSIFPCGDNTINTAYGPDNRCDAAQNSSVNYQLGANVFAYAPTLRALDASFTATVGNSTVARAAAAAGNSSGFGVPAGYQGSLPNTLYSNSNIFH